MKKKNKLEFIKKDTNRNFKLAQYSMLAGAFMVSAPSCDDDDDIGPGPSSSITHTDIDPDFVGFTSGFSSFDLDLNHDGVVDFSLSAWNSNYSYYGYPMTVNAISIYPYNGNAVAGVVSPYGYSYAGVLNAGANIGSNQNWVNGTYQTLIWETAIQFGVSYFYTWGSWIGEQNDKYLGLKVYDSGSEHYAWVRLSTSQSQWSFTVQEYAYETSANQSITAGSNLIEDVNRSSIVENPDITIYNFDKTLIINDKKKRDFKARVKNHKGKELYNGIMKKKGEVQLESGLNNVEIELDNQKITKEVLIK